MARTVGWPALTPLTQLYHPAILYVIAFDGKPYQCTYLMPALPSCGTGVHVQALQGFVEHDLEDMRMTADKQLRTQFPEPVFYTGGIFARVTADMLHVHFYFFAGKEQFFGVVAADIIAIDIAVNPAQGFYKG